MLSIALMLQQQIAKCKIFTFYAFRKEWVTPRVGQTWDKSCQESRVKSQIGELDKYWHCPQMTREGSGEDDRTFRVGSTYSNQVKAPSRAFMI